MKRRPWANAPYCVTTTSGQTFRVEFKGRDRWALEALRNAGAIGCTPITTPGPRWSAYVFNLRGAGIEVDTLNEAHGGEFAGHHARYVLRSTVRPLNDGGAQ